MKIEEIIIIRINGSRKELGFSPRDRQGQEGTGMRGSTHRFIQTGYYIFGMIQVIANYHENLMSLIVETVHRMI